jgi:hypothetical protein
MIWIIASIPFWAVAAMLAIVAAVCTWSGLHTSMYRRGVAAGKLDQSQHAYFMIGVGAWIAAGLFALLAAKICS